MANGRGAPIRPPSLPTLSLFKVYERMEQQTAPATPPEDDAQREETGGLGARPQRARCSQSRKLTSEKRSKVRGPLSFRISGFASSGPSPSCSRIYRIISRQTRAQGGSDRAVSIGNWRRTGCPSPPPCVPSPPARYIRGPFCLFPLVCLTISKPYVCPPPSTVLPATDEALCAYFTSVYSRRSTGSRWAITSRNG